MSNVFFIELRCSDVDWDLIDDLTSRGDVLWDGDGFVEPLVQCGCYVVRAYNGLGAVDLAELSCGHINWFKLGTGMVIVFGFRKIDALILRSG